VPQLDIGCDVGLDFIWSAFLGEGDVELGKRLRVPYTPEGLQELFERIDALIDKHGITRVRVGIESTGSLGVHLCEAFHTHEPFHRIDTILYLINPRLVSRFKESLGELPKTDDIDSWVIAQRLRIGGLSPLHRSDDRYVALQKLTRHRVHLVECLVAEKNRFLDQLFLQFSGFRQAPPTDPFGAAMGALLTELLTVDEIATKPIEELVALLQEHSANSFPDPEKVASALQLAAKRSHRLRIGLQDPVKAVLTMTLQNIRYFEKAIKDIEKLIDKQLDALPEATVLLSVRGFGRVIVAGLLAEIQEISRFPSEAQIAKMAGLAWKRWQTGRFEADETPLLKSANMYLRHYLVLGANSLRTCNEEYRAYYQAKYREAKKHHHKRALVLTARKEVRLVDALLRSGRIYQPRTEWEDARQELPEKTPPQEIARHIVRRRQEKHQKVPCRS
jgi:transposase